MDAKMRSCDRMATKHSLRRRWYNPRFDPPKADPMGRSQPRNAPRGLQPFRTYQVGANGNERRTSDGDAVDGASAAATVHDDRDYCSTKQHYSMIALIAPSILLEALLPIGVK